MKHLIKAAVVALGMAGGAGLASAQAAPVGFDAGLTTQGSTVEQVQYYARPYGGGYGYGHRFRPRGYGYRPHFGYGPRFGYGHRRHFGPGFRGGRGYYRY